VDAHSFFVAPKNNIFTAMLQKLHIRNYAIIEELAFEPGAHLNIITGETGAGKSILMGALSLILGERADLSVLLNKDKKCIVEGWFETTGREEVLAFLQQEELDTESSLCIRREISHSGKSRAFINDTPVTLVQLQQLSNLLVDLHQQFDTLQLGSQSFQRTVLDTMAGHGETVGAYRKLYQQLSRQRQELSQLEAEQLLAQKELDYHRFLYNELQEAALGENELEDLDAELKLLSNAEQVKSVLGQMSMALGTGEDPLVQKLKQIQQMARQLGDVQKDIPALLERLHAAQVELQDITDELERINDKLVLDPRRLEWVNERMATGYRLLKKHGLQTTARLRSLQEELETKLQFAGNLDATIARVRKETQLLTEQAEKAALAMRATREKQAKPFAQKVTGLLHQVGMPNAVLKIECKPVPLYEWGIDEIEFLFDANKSGRFEPLRKVASGGELSRLMLCIKSLAAQKMQMPTLIFDEIDTGISGEAARQAGIIMKELATRHQVFCITHQAQIAAMADAHYFVYKEIKQDRIGTSLRQLNHDERIQAIARMMSGEKPTAAALENAREMVGN
jgi:DNA repair protein RecN (Recombination protein N)